jgi:hypothetical protein
MKNRHHHHLIEKIYLEISIFFLIKEHLLGEFAPSVPMPRRVVDGSLDHLMSVIGLQRSPDDDFTYVSGAPAENDGEICILLRL